MTKKKKPFSILEEYGVIKESSNSNWRIEVNRVSWYERPATIDIRNFSNKQDGELIVGKGISLDEDTVYKLYCLLTELGFNNKKEKSIKKKIKKYKLDE